MWADKRYNDQPFTQRGSISAKNNAPLTPRNKMKPNVPLPHSRRSVTPTRVQERATTSPLRVPLERAVQKCARQKSQERPSSRSRMTNRSSRHGESSIIYRRGAYEDEESVESNRRYHDQTVGFLKKYFDFQFAIPKQNFIDRLIQEYGDLWSDQNSQQFLCEFTWKILQIFGEYIEPRQLLTSTQNDGMIGLILHICQQIQQTKQNYQNHRSNYTSFLKSPNMMSINKSFEQQVGECASVQNLKNVIQQFMETMYQAMEKQIYEKFNAEMKRMVLKHREADKMLKKVSQKLINHADYFDAESRWKNKIKVLELQNMDLAKKIQKKQQEVTKEKEGNYQLRSTKLKLQEEINKLKENNQKYQNILLQKFQNLPSSQSSLPTTPSIISHSRKIPSNGPLLDRTQEFSNQNSAFNTDPKPFQFKMETHFIHRDSGPPVTQTTTTFIDKNVSGPPPPPIYPLSESNLSSKCYSPIKINSQALESGRPSFEHGIKPGTKIGDLTYSPYQGRTPRNC